MKGDEASKAERLGAAAGLAGAVYLTCIFYALALPSLGLGARRVFGNWISEAILVMGLWGVFLVLWKWREVRRDWKAYRSVESPRALWSALMSGAGTGAGRLRAVSRCVRERLSAAGVPDGSLVRDRCGRLLRFFRHSTDYGLVDQEIARLTERDLGRAEMGFRLIKTLVWALPMVGFLGTVVGIGQAISGFSGFVDGGSAADIQARMRSALSGVIDGLAMAFNTTLLGLVFVLPIQSAAVFLHKRREELVLALNDWSHELHFSFFGRGRAGPGREG